MFAFPTQGRKGIDRLPYVDSTLKRQYNRRFLLFQQREVSVFFLLDRTAFTGDTGKKKKIVRLQGKALLQNVRSQKGTILQRKT